MVNPQYIWDNIIANRKMRLFILVTNGASELNKPIILDIEGLLVCNVIHDLPFMVFLKMLGEDMGRHQYRSGRSSA